VVVHHGRIEILDKLYFAADSDELKASSLPIVQAIAATLKGNPQITLLDVQGHAADSERAPWGVAARRAAAVRRQLTRLGVDARRLRVVVHGPSLPVDPRPTEEARAKNRRVEFVIAARSDREEPSSRAGSRARPGAASASAVKAPAAAGAAAVRYELPGRVSVPRASSALVSIVNQAMGSEEILLYRPEAGVAGSDQHPFRAARLKNESGHGLVAGPVAIFSRGSFAGEGLLQRLGPGESAFIPFALERGTAVEVERRSASEPRRLVSVVDGVATVEDEDALVTRYRIRSGQGSPARLFLKHPRHAGYRVAELPPGSELLADAYLLPLPLAAGRTSVLAVREARPLRRSVRLLEDATRLDLYLSGSALPGEASGQLKQLALLRRKLAAEEQKASDLRARLGDASDGNAELRRSLVALSRAGGDAALRARLLARMKSTLELTDRLGRELAGASAAEVELRAQLRALVGSLRLDGER